MAAHKSVARVVAGTIVRSLGDARLPWPRRIAIVSGFALSGTRLALGTVGGALGPRPKEPLILYEFEGCPFCRKVRETLSILDLDAHIRPCPKNGKRFRPEVAARGKEKFPFLIDPNTGKELYESSVIVRYLFDTYGAGKPPAYLLSEPATMISGAAASLLSGRRGSFTKASRQPEKELELYAYEASPFSRLTRQVLCELELPYLLHTVARGSPRRKAFREKSGKMQVPYLIDPNSSRAMFESDDIERYLYSTYGKTVGNA